MILKDQSLIITIDGPCGSGKSTVAKSLAEYFNMPFLETGAMYRALAFIAIEENLDPSDGDLLCKRAKDLNLSVELNSRTSNLFLDGKIIKDELRRFDVTKAVSPVSAQPSVREYLVYLQRKAADIHPRLVTEGRDQGSVVFPDAKARFYLTASVQERARRRSVDMTKVDDLGFDEILNSILKRDEFDMNREIGPLICPDGAIVINSDGVSKEDVVNLMIGKVKVLLENDE